MKTKVVILIFFFGYNGFSQLSEIDISFGNNGKVVTGFGSNRNTANAIAFQPDGKCIVGGSYTSTHGETDFALVRYNSDGSLDDTFGNKGKVVTDFLAINNDYSFIHSLYILPDGKVIAIGSSGKVGVTTTLAVVKYNNNGSIDTTFGTNGIIISGLIPFTTFGSKLVFQPDGKFLITSAKKYSLDPNYYFGVERYTQNGSLDLTFGSNGEAVALFGTGQNAPSSIAIQSDGKIVVAGKYTPTNISQIAVARFNTDGTLDTSFDADGKLTTSFGNGTFSQAIQVASSADGKIIVTGIVYASLQNFAIVKYNSNGSLDTSFDGDGKAMNALVDFYDNISSITTQPDGKYLVVIRSDNTGPSYDLIVRRYNTDITIDTTFGNNGQVNTTFNTGQNEAQAAAIANDGKIILVGKSVPIDNSNIDFAIARYTVNGTLDTSFDTDGKVTAAFEKGNDQLNQLLVQADNKFVAVGTSGYRQSNNSTFKNIALSKYNSDGSLDTTFGTLGKVVSVFGQNLNLISTAILQSDEKIIVGNTYYNLSIDNSYHYELIRYNANGSLDSSFGTNGKVSTNFESSSIVIQPDGKIVVAGIGSPNSGERGFIINRYNIDGTLDTTFDNDGTTYVLFGDNYFGKVSVLLQSDGKIVVTGSASNPNLYNNVQAFVAARLNSNGTLDATFGNNGKVATLINDTCTTYAGFLQPDSKLIISGISSDGGSINFSSLRYTTDGLIDSTYGVNGILSTNLSNDYRIINNILFQPDGKFLVALSKFNQPLNSYDFKIKRINPDGTYDNDFGGSNGIATSFFNGYDEAFSISLQSDNKIIVAGTTNDGITNDFAITRFTNSILDVENFNNISNTIAIYPNPTKDILNIKIANNNGIEIIKYAVYNMLGQIIYKNSNEKFEVDTSTFMKGIYNLEIKTNQGFFNKKFIRE